MWTEVGYCQINLVTKKAGELWPDWIQSIKKPNIYVWELSQGVFVSYKWRAPPPPANMAWITNGQLTVQGFSRNAILPDRNARWMESTAKAKGGKPPLCGAGACAGLCMEMVAERDSFLKRHSGGFRSGGRGERFSTIRISCEPYQACHVCELPTLFGSILSLEFQTTSSVWWAIATKKGLKDNLFSRSTTQKAGLARHFLSISTNSGADFSPMWFLHCTERLV